MRKNEAKSFASIMAVVLKLGIYFMDVVANCLHFVMSYIKQNKSAKTLSRVHNTDWKKPTYSIL